MTSSFKSVGVSGLPQWGGVIMVEDDPKLAGLSGVRKFSTMRRTDATAAAMYYALAMPIGQTTWAMTSGPTSADEAAGVFAKGCFDDMHGSFSDLISDACQIFVYGWSWFDMSMKKRTSRTSKHDDGRVGFDWVAFRSPHRLSRWEFSEDDSTDLVGMWQMVYPGETKRHPTGGEVLLELYRSLLFRTSPEGGNPEGISIFRPAVRPFDYKRKLERVEGIGLYRRWAGFPQVNLPKGASKDSEVEEGEVSDETKARKLVTAIYEDRMMGAYLPDGWKLDFGGPQGTVDDTLSQTIVRKDTEMARAALAQFLLLGLSNTGSRALADSWLELYYLVCDSFLDGIASVLNRRAIPYLFKFNPWPGMTEYPRLVPSTTKKLELQSIGEFILALARAGSFTPDDNAEDFLRSLVPGMPKLPEEKAGVLRAVSGQGNGEDDDDGGGEGDGAGPDTTDDHTLPGVVHFAAVPPGDRLRRYHEIADLHAAAQRGNLEALSASLAGRISGLGPETSEVELRGVLREAVLTGMYTFRQQSSNDITAAFWTGYGGHGGGEALSVLQREVVGVDQWIGYAGPGEVRRTNPAGGGTLFGDILEEVEAQIPVILLLLADRREDDVWVLVTDAVRAATRSYSRGELYSGHVWRALWVGALERGKWEEATTGIPAGPYRWALDPIARHCPTCLRFGEDPPGREYPSVSALFSITGGILPGFGTECDGNCRCTLYQLQDGTWVVAGY